MEKANELIKRIIDIDNSAIKMSQAADNEKLDAYNEYNKKIADFDKKLAEEYEKKYQDGILKIDNEFNTVKEKDSEVLETETNESGLHGEKKESRINEILKEIIGV